MKVGINFSTFNLLHADHIKMLEEAKTYLFDGRNILDKNVLEKIGFILVVIGY